MKIFAAIQKVEENSDGTLKVEGIASTESTDSDGEVIKASAIAAAIPDFMRYGTGNLREMHQPIAAGTVDKAEVADGVTHIAGTVVDPVAITKVKAGVYKGFSIGGKVTARDDLNKKEITGVKLVEISLVDRPANPEAVLSMWKAEGLEDIEQGEQPTSPAPNNGEEFEQVWRSKRDQSVHVRKADLIAHHKSLDDASALNAVAGSALEKIGQIEAALGTTAPAAEGGEGKEASETGEELDKRKFTAEERREAASSGAAMKDGSYPIENESDLENAIRAFGRAKNKPATKRHIIRRAKALGATDKLPEDWRGSTKKGDEPGDLAKGVNLYDLSDLIMLLSNLQRAEERFESNDIWGNGVAVPDSMKTRFGSLLVEFADIVADALEILLGAITEEEADEALERAAKPGDLAKVETPASDDLHKLAAERDVFKAAFEKVSGKIDDITPQITKMAEEIAVLKAQPMPAKTAGAGPVAISKEFDTIGRSAEPVMTKAELDQQLAVLSPEDRALALIKLSRENPLAVAVR